ncbi:Vacuolar membrane [Hyphodiscus hymeniophilus]|uniref:Vacuolar membrane n=1 Tax=Hyphodiscus hymeniophilus TaxID=353542 RepID=A0A9P7AZF3_9HELO|nr:Vacuolar membrane [Hyphodiscus hymeniophilus]
MRPPPGFEPALTSLLENGSPTTLLSSAVATASSLMLIGVDTPSQALSSIVAISTAIATQAGKDEPKPDNGECELLGPFAIVVQGALGALALLALVYKRWRERPQRPVKIWFFDVSKQVVGSVLLHIANLLMSMLSSGQLSMKINASSVSGRQLGALAILGARGVDVQGKYTPNPCSFYLLNLAIDTTIGIPILIILLRILTALLIHTPFGQPPQSIQSGNYGSPPRAAWWMKQSFIYFIGLMGMKLCVLVIFLLAPWISRVGDWALRWTEGDEALQVIFVMLVFPVIMNATQYYIIDSFIKNQKPEHELIPDDDDEIDDEGDFREDPSSSDDVLSTDEDAELAAKGDAEGKKVAVERVKRKSEGSGVGSPREPRLFTGNKDYDPMYDGENSPTVVGSSKSERERLVHTGDSDDERPDSLK